jgi:hypothetical protein
MKKTDSRKYSRASAIGFVLWQVMSNVPLAFAQVGLYDVFERQVTNSKSYANPFDFNVIELQASFRSPSGRTITFFGFYDGNGNGGQTGNVWKLRFMPDEVGVWMYAYNWTDGTPGGAGSFIVTDTGLPGPLKVATDNPWYFMTVRGEPFHLKAYDMHATPLYSPTGPAGSLLTNLDWFKYLIQTGIINNGYNFTMWAGPTNRKATTNNALWKESWWLNTKDTKRFNIPVWHAWESALTLSKDNKVYVIPFVGMIMQGAQYNFSDFKVFLRYWVARFAPFYNFFGWNPTWEWMDIWSPDEVDQIMQYLHDVDPWKRLLSVHDCSHSRFAGWIGFSMRQAPSRNVFMGNSRIAGQRQRRCDGPGGIGSPFVNKPILGSEDIWESGNADQWKGWTMPRNKTEVRRAAWGIQMAGVMPLYSEWANSGPPPPGGSGEGEPEVRRMYDFVYSKTRYRQYRQLNSLVSASAGQIASGIPGEEYLVYDQDGGSIAINLAGVPTSTFFSEHWYDPKTGAEQSGGRINGGVSRTLISPFLGDTVLLLKQEKNQITGPAATTR